MPHNVNHVLRGDRMNLRRRGNRRRARKASCEDEKHREQDEPHFHQATLLFERLRRSLEKVDKGAKLEKCKVCLSSPVAARVTRD
jgi:hypothetical protein